jgi:sugar phosphate isomerase/epimerase
VKVGVTIYSLHQYCESGRMSVADFIDFCAGLGMDGVDLGYYWHDVDRELPEARQRLDRHHLEVGAYIVGNNFAQPTAERLDAEVARVKRAVDEAVALGARTLRIFVGDQSGAMYAQVRERVLPPLRTVADYATAHHVVLAVENHGTLAGRADEILDILRSVDSPFLRANVDIGNWMAVGEDPVDSTQRVAPYAALCHVKDVRREDGRLVPCAVGEGDVDLVGCFAALREGGYDGYLSVEYENPEDATEGTRCSVAATRRALDAVTRMS